MIYAGIFGISLLIGYLIGASNSPVVGAFITAVIGFAGVAVGAKHLAPEGRTQSVSSFTGMLLLILAGGIFAGEIGGEAFRRGWLFGQERQFLWDSRNQPEETREAIDWLVVAEKLSNLGYTHAQIVDIYSIRAEERSRLSKIRAQQIESEVDPYALVEVYDSASPYHELLEVPAGETAGRGPASTR